MRPLLLSSIAFVVSVLTVAWAAPVIVPQSAELLSPRAGLLSPRAGGGETYITTIDGQKLKVKKNGDQGIHGVVYQVLDGPWKGAFAKAKVADQEIQATHDVGALLGHGRDAHGQRWAIIRPSPGKRLDRTDAFKRVQHNPNACWSLLNHAIELTSNKIMSEYHRTHWLHEDPVLSNVLFDDRVTQAYLIDWGYATRPASVPLAKIRAEVTDTFARSGVCPPRQTAHRPAAPPPPSPPRRILVQRPASPSPPRPVTIIRRPAPPSPPRPITIIRRPAPPSPPRPITIIHRRPKGH
ncbi:hypothetical protein DAEQUDRAFT_183699 [Daedalea quercina L-15889]|uniref:Aminoglycoside phosphotransferase domain-containing protein n=1 Tax=Daedalea quercina L-15889 TaxID=1314783 RepID=A0A165RFU2_9APHY|nr:hypothetical protein DAEQUDRAFT_183699 [Daedalea quercina L-15889]